MLRRAASNAYSWWWASHVRTKQSKWLEENLQEIEEKVHYALKLLEDEGDSFAKRAEMYYKRRPELIIFVEETFKAYRALAERYDHISKELQNANTTIASVFPDQVPEFAMDEDDDVPISPKNHKTPTGKSNQSIPKVPHLPIKDSGPLKMFKQRKSMKESAPAVNDSVTAVVNKSGMNKTEGVEEIDKLQKEILVLQTEKEFVKSSYENSLAKYWEIENFIMEKQGKICNLQDEFDEGVAIEDGEAQILMSTTALKSCQEKLTELRNQQKKHLKETDIARKQIKESAAEFLNLSGHSLLSEERTQETGLMKPKEDIEADVSSCLNITDVAEKIDELVNDVISLENSFSSQAGLIHRLRQEIEELKSQIRALQEEKKLSQTNDSTILRNKVKEMKEKLKNIQDLDQRADEQNLNIEKDLTKAQIKLSKLSEKLTSLKQEDKEIKSTNVQFPDQESSNVTKIAEESKENVTSEAQDHGDAEIIAITEKQAPLMAVEKQISSPKSDIETEEDKNLLAEYTKVLRSYKEVKKRLEETETKLKSENTMKDEQIRELNRKLSLLLKSGESKASDHQKDQLFMLICREDNAINAISGKNQILSPNEQQFRARVDALLGENLDLLVRFSNSFGQIQQFETGIKDLQAEISKIKEQKNQNGDDDNNNIKSDVRPLYKHLTEIRTELTVWLEKSFLLKDEISSRSTTLSNIQKEITEAGKTETETKFTIYQGAKFEGEVSNMRKENDRIAEELQGGLDQVTRLQQEAVKTLEKLNDEYSLSESKNHSNVQESSQVSKTRIPLRSFLFETKVKKQKLSIFSCMQPSLYKKMR